jgi:hypothetical protein
VENAIRKRQGKYHGKMTFENAIGKWHALSSGFFAQIVGAKNSDLITD